MERFWLNAAGRPAEVTVRYPQVRRLCRDYELPQPDGPAALTVSVSQKDIARMADTGETAAFSPAYLEFLCVQEALAAQLPALGRFLMHGAAIAYDGEGYLFTAPSGTGKSTHIRLWRQFLGKRVSVVNGDKPFLSLEPPGSGAPVRVWGSPWAGKEGWQQCVSVPLRGICVLERGADCIRRLTPSQALEPLFCQIYHRDDPDVEFRTLGFLDTLLRTVPVFRLSCGMTEDAVRCSFEALTGRSYTAAQTALKEGSV